MSEQGGRDEAIQHDVHHGGRRTLEGDVVADRGPGVPASNPSGVNPSVSSARAEQKFPIAQACPECGKPIQIQRHDGIVYVEGRSAPAAIDSLMDRASDVPDGRSQGGRQAAPVVGGGSVASASDPAPYVFDPDTNALGNLGARTWEVEEARAESSTDGYWEVPLATAVRLLATLHNNVEQGVFGKKHVCSDLCEIRTFLRDLEESITGIPAGDDLPGEDQQVRRNARCSCGGHFRWDTGYPYLRCDGCGARRQELNDDKTATPQTIECPTCKGDGCGPFGADSCGMCGGEGSLPVADASVLDASPEPYQEPRERGEDAHYAPDCNLPPLSTHALTTPQRPDWTCGCCGRVWRHNTSLGGGYWEEIQGPRPSVSATHEAHAHPDGTDHKHLGGWTPHSHRDALADESWLNPKHVKASTTPPAESVDIGLYEVLWHEGRKTVEAWRDVAMNLVYGFKMGSKEDEDRALAAYNALEKHTSVDGTSGYA